MNKTTSLNATVAVTPTTCGRLPAEPPRSRYLRESEQLPLYIYPESRSPFTHGQQPQQFTGLAAGTDTITVVDASGGCHSNIPVTITATGSLTVNFTVTPRVVSGIRVSNGGLGCRPQRYGSHTYTVNHPIALVFTITQANNGTFNTSARRQPPAYSERQRGCQATDVPFTVASGPQINPDFHHQPHHLLLAPTTAVLRSPAPITAQPPTSIF